MKTFYITSPIFYPNAHLHMGHAYTMTLADILTRYHLRKGESVYFLTGTDENTAKVTKAAADKGLSVEEYLKDITAAFKELYSELGIEYSQFIQTTDKELHWPGAIELWKRLLAADDIYKSSYEGLYCPSCEAFYTEKDLVDGKCPFHGTVPEKLKEENYFFRLSRYTATIKEKILSDEFAVVPHSRKNEILALLDRGLEDISFSRPAQTVSHGIPVPGDPTQVMYVWCDALANYISAIGFGRNQSKFESLWPADVHVIGKDILRFHAAIWPAMLLSAKLPLPKALLVHGFITSGGKKMSKSLGNVIDPRELIAEYGKEALRYFLAREVSPFEDGDITKEGFKASYNANLANGLGNLVSRVLKLSETHIPEGVAVDYAAFSEPQEITEAFIRYDIKAAADYIWSLIGSIDRSIQERQPFKVVKEDKEKGIEIIRDLVLQVARVGHLIAPFLPETSEKIKAAIESNKMPVTPLFARKE